MNHCAADELGSGDPEPIRLVAQGSINIDPQKWADSNCYPRAYLTYDPGAGPLPQWIRRTIPLWSE